jgi:hypothetical protein
VIRLPVLCIAIDSVRRREGSIAISIDTLILQDLRILDTAAGRGAVIEVSDLSHTPLAIEEVEHVLHIEAKLEHMLGVTDIQLKVVLVADIHAVNPRRIVAVSLSILTLMT